MIHSSPHDVDLSMATAGELEAGGAGWSVVAGQAESPFGICMVAETPRGISHLLFDEWDRIYDGWPRAAFVRDDERAKELIHRIFSPEPGLLNLHVRGSSFQERVWRMLLCTKRGDTVCYGELAGRIGRPNASRAVGAAVGRNPVAFIIPCHRVVPASGSLGKYRWGTERKRAMLAWEG